jgi:hypothetical protein
MEVQNTQNLYTFYANIVGSNDGPDVSASTAAGTLSKNQWYHVAAVFDGATSTRQVSLYINGVLKQTTSIPSPGVIGINGDEKIGGCPVPPGQCYLGWISGVRMYARALSANEILNLYNARQ